MERVTRSVLAAFAAGLFSTIAFTGAEAATITVDSLADAVPASGAAGCTLRKAIENANNGVQTHAACAPPGAATNDIVFAVNGIIQLVASGAGTGVLNLTRTVNILGNGTGNTIIRGAPNEHVFDNFGGPVMSISWQTLTIANGNASAATGFTNAGAAYIETTTTATMNTVVVTNNIAVSSAGAIDNRGTLIITNSSFTLNSAPGQGGAIRNVGKLTITNSTFSGNTSGEGGAIHHASSTAGSTLDIANSTFSGNSATGGAAGGGAVSVNSDLAATLTYVTIANNSATTGSGGGLRFNPATLGGGSVVISKSIIAGNTAAVAGADCNTTSTAFASQNFNVFGSLSGCTLGVQANDFTGAALLNPLANNGGPTLTLLPLPYSPARGRIPAASCGLGTDQRGAGRPSGTGCDSGAVEATPTVPQAPTIGTATAGIGQASVSFTAPANNGDSPILSYTATSSPGGITASCGAPCSSIVVGGLTGGVSYTFTVTAANVLGSSVASAASNAVLVTSAPGAPTIGVANAGNTQAVVPFTAPANTGGLPITGYTATSNPSGLTGSCVTPCVFIFVNGLANGTAYTFTVTATNAVGTGPASAASNSVTPIGAPNAPVIGTATAGDAQATVTFAPPAFDGGSPITGYAAIASPGGLVGTCTAPCSSITVTGLTNGVVYTFTVAADNAAGGGADSAPSNSVMPTGVPSAPIIGSATSGNAQATIAFSAPATDGGVAITQYTATSSPSGITGACAAPCSLITVAGLANGTAYTFTVTATNALGTGPASAASNSVTPATIPDAPTIGVALPGNQNVFVPFTPGSDGGSPILQYSAILVPGGFTGTCGAGCTSILVIGLTNGTAYTARVQAINALGSSISAPSNSVTPRTVPDPPIIGTATAGNAQATVTFSPPAFDGFSPITLYRASSTPGFFTGTCVAPCSSITVPGLANGTAYTFVIQADNAAGSGGNSASSNSVTPIGTPGAPTIGLATGGNGQASVTFAAPAFDGGTPITSYTATSSPGGFTGACAAPCTSIAVIGLANGTAYTFTVAATNAVGIGAASAASNSVTPATVPGAPTIGTATGGNAQASVTFAAPASNGGSAVTLYTATSAPGAITGTCAAPCTTIPVSGLANGTAYTFTVTASNAVGTGAASAASNSVTPATVPGAPVIGVATGGNAQATVGFAAPASNGGAAIASFTAISTPGGFTGTCTAPCTSIVVAGLANATAYTFTVTATNAVGASAASAPSNSVTPQGPPNAPVIGTATGGNAQATVLFTAPAFDGGSPITVHTATSSPGGLTGNCLAPCTSIVVAGLTNGTAYTFTVTATNAIGTGPASAASNSVTPATVPGAPAIGAATGGNTQATVAFTAPGSNGGSAITSFTATSSPGGITGSCAAPCTSIVVAGLSNGTAYTFTVVAANAVGTGAASGASNAVTPSAVPGAPTIGTATAGNAQATVTFTAPASNGGSPIASYTATSSPAGLTGTCAAPCTSIVVAGLSNGTAYTFTVTATNASGAGPASAASNSVTPATVPGAPIIGTATRGNAQASVAFTAPASNGGSAITTFTATSSPGGLTGTCTAPCTSIVVAGLANGTVYTFTVTATNASGTGPASAPSNAVTPATVPGAPTIGIATPGNLLAIIAFGPPASDGGSPITSYTAACTPGAAITSGGTSPLTVAGLANGTVYVCAVRATNAVGTGTASATVGVTPVFNTFTGPSATGTGTITAAFVGGGPACSFATPSFISAPPGAPPVPPVAPPDVFYPHGLFDFSATGCTAGATLAFRIKYPAPLPPGTQYWKYGPTASDPSPHWYVLPSVISGDTVTFSITDGGLGDDDLVANGTVVDQGGPGAPAGAANIPTLSEWAMGMLALLLCWVGFRQQRGWRPR